MEKLCRVIVDDLTIEEIESIYDEQKNTASPNEREGEESAFKKALTGSKIFLKAQGYIKETEG
ncbi:MAG: hypothetical protein U0L58_09365 [Ruminococcus sp.]|nr:hypothetical protein [Ruminococcus sp.]